MKTLTVTGLGLTVLGLITSTASAQERIPQDEAERYAKILSEKAQSLDDAPFTLKVDTAKPSGVRHDEYGAMVIPASGLTAESLPKDPATTLPLGQLWLRKLAPQVSGQVIDDGKLRTVTATVDGNEYTLPLILLGLKVKEKDQYELLLYGKGKEPVTRLPLTAITSGGKGNAALDLDGKDNGDGTGTLVLRVLGKYEAQLTVLAKD